ncbi:MAG: hypothetical protein ACD_62C00394G0003 [uncultured bacterium]|nr:MAG: hypothetical protein ACD_62C00394G0003 [uncultured bacterium]
MDQIIVSGTRPTNYLHLGNYHGALENWVKLQQQAQFKECFFFVADWHALTTGYDNTDEIKYFSQQMVIDWLAFGLNPDRATIFVQSQVPEHAELNLLLSMITPLGWLERVPTYKDQQQELSHKDLSTHGFLGYPVLQTADVALYNATHVPVGQDQVPHIELSREIVRRFNFIFKTELLIEPQALLTNVPVLPGTDGRKMSKSYHNSIYLKDTPDEVQKKILPMMTDPARQRRTDAGDPAKCPVFSYHKIYSGDEIRQEVAHGCQTAGIGCVDCKKKLLSQMETCLAPYRQKRLDLATQEKQVRDVIEAGNAKARRIATTNMNRIKDIVKI